MKWEALKHRIQKAIADKKSEFHGYDFNEALSILVRERFVARAAHSAVSDSVILKGGLLLTALYTKQSRFTMDTDLNLKNAEGLDSFRAAVDAIIKIDLEDGFKFTRDEGQIMDADSRLYDGARFQIHSTFGTSQKLTFTLDFGVGDIVTPLRSKLPILPETTFSSVEMQVYPPETIAAEKLQTCVEKAEQNSRMKDYYDLYFLRDIVDLEKFKTAAQKTFEHRGTQFPGQLPNPAILQPRWNQFLKSSQQRVIKSISKDLSEVMQVISEFYGAKGEP